MAQIDIIDGLGDNLGLKAPVRCVIRELPDGEAFGLGPVVTVGDGTITLEEDDRVLYAPASANVDAGIFNVSSTAWARSPDFDGARDAISGTRVFTVSGRLWRLTTEDPITIGTTPLLFAQDLFANLVSGDVALIANVAALRALTDDVSSSAIFLVGYYSSTVLSGPDGGGGFFLRDDEDGVSADDGGTVIVDAVDRRWKRVTEGRLNVKWFGAVGDGVTDDADAINAALTVAAGPYDVVEMPQGVYRVASTVTVPIGVKLQGAGIILPSSEGSTIGTAIVGDNTVSPVVQAGTVPDSIIEASTTCDGFSVFRTGSAPASSIGLKLVGGQGDRLSNIFSYGHADDIYLYGQNGSEGDAIAVFLDHVYTGKASDNHLVIDTIPEVRLDQCRFGANGSGDLDCNAYIKITGGIGAAPAAGPNTVVANNCQFNQGENAPDYWLSFEGMTSPGLPTLDARVFLFSACHVEAVGSAFIHADSTWASIDRLGLVNNNFSMPSADFFDLPRTTLAFDGVRISSNYIAAASFAPDIDNVNGFVVAGNTFEGGAISYDSGSVGSWTMTSMGNTYAVNATVTIAGSKFSSAIFADAYRTGSTFTNNISDGHENVTVLNPGKSLINWTPVLTFGGLSTGITYNAATTKGAMHIVGNQVTYEWRIKLTSKGSATGEAKVAGFPVPQNTGLFQTGAGGVCFGNSNMLGLTSTIIAQGPVETAPGDIALLQQGAIGTEPLDDTNFTNTSDFAGSVSFFF